MEKKNLDWANIGFNYIETDERYVSDYKDGAWDEGRMTKESRWLSMNVRVCFNMRRRFLKG